MSDEPLITAPVGSVLQQARESLGLTQREVGDALNVSQSIIDAVESGDKSRLPAFVFTRGYVRAYAKLLEIDAEGLVAALALQYGESQSPVEGEVQASATTQNKWSGLAQELLRHPQAIRSVVVAALLVVAVLFLFGGDESEKADETEEVDEVEEVQSTPQLQDVVLPEPPQGSIPQPVAGNTGPDELAASALDDTEPAAAERRLTATGENRLSLSITEDCWIEVKDIEGNLLYGDLGRAGQFKRFVGEGPFRVVLGYAPGVAMRYNDEPIVLGPHTRSNVASLVIGQ